MLEIFLSPSGLDLKPLVLSSAESNVGMQLRSLGYGPLRRP
jgi:hypothetical protein